MDQRYYSNFNRSDPLFTSEDNIDVSNGRLS